MISHARVHNVADECSGHRRLWILRPAPWAVLQDEGLSATNDDRKDFSFADRSPVARVDSLEKADWERHLNGMAAGASHVIFRPTLTYGTGVIGNIWGVSLSLRWRGCRLPL